MSDSEFVIPAASTPTPAPTPPESSYHADELVAGAKGAFGVESYVMRAMLKSLGKTQMTRTEAQAALIDFLSRPA